MSFTCFYCDQKFITTEELNTHIKENNHYSVKKKNTKANDLHHRQTFFCYFTIVRSTSGRFLKG